MTTTLDAFRGAAALTARDPVAAMRFAPWAEKFLADASQFRLIRACNQIGKTEVVTADLVHELRGTNPYRTRRFSGPLNVILVSESIEQMAGEGAILEKLWTKLPKDEIDPAVYFERGHGLRGVRHPAITFVRGPAAGSVIRLRTYRQDPQTLAGSTVHHIVADEPCPESTYAELVPRILAHGGTFTVSFTPTPAMSSQDWLRKLVDAGQFSQHHVTMRPENAWPRGYARPFLTQEKIDAFAASLPNAERGMRLEASWEPLAEGRWLTAFSPSNVKPFDLGALPRESFVVVGIDHGLKAGKQAAVLAVVANRFDPQPRIWFVDEAQSDGHTTVDQDAAAILAMLARNGLKYEHVDAWTGDRQTGDGLILKSKTNKDLRAAFGRILGKAWKDESLGYIHTPVKWAGSLTHGLRLLNGAFGEGRAIVHPRCQRFAEACNTFRGGKFEPCKDILDAGRYAMEYALRGTKPEGFKGSY